MFVLRQGSMKSIFCSSWLNLWSNSSFVNSSQLMVKIWIDKFNSIERQIEHSSIQFNGWSKLFQPLQVALLLQLLQLPLLLRLLQLQVEVWNNDKYKMVTMKMILLLMAKSSHHTLLLLGGKCPDPCTCFKPDPEYTDVNNHHHFHHHHHHHHHHRHHHHHHHYHHHHHNPHHFHHH